MPYTPVYTGAQFKAAVATHLNRTDLTVLIPDFCNLAVKELEKKKLWFQLAHQTAVPTAANVEYSSLPADFLFEIEKEIGETLLMPPTNYNLTKLPYPEIVYYQTAGTTHEKPYYFAITDRIDWYPIPDQAYTLTNAPQMSYYKHLGFPDDALYNAWTDEVWDLTFWAVIAEASRYLENESMLMKAMERREKKLSEYLNQHGLRQAVGRVRLTRF